jgi:hypothetical protein
VSTTVRVRLDDALVGSLPPVCVMTGDAADGYAPMIVPRRLGIAWLLLLAGPIGVAVLIGLYPRLRTRYAVRVPTSEPAFERWHSARARRLWCSWLGGMGLVAAFALRWIGPLAALVALASLLLIGAALRAHWQVPWRQPTMSADPGGRTITMAGVHERFATAVANRPSPRSSPRSLKRNAR